MYVHTGPFPYLPKLAHWFLTIQFMLHTLRYTTTTSMKIMFLLTLVLARHLQLPVRQLQVLYGFYIICPLHKYLTVYPVTYANKEFKDDSDHALKKCTL